MKSTFTNYVKSNYICFSLDIVHTRKNDGKWKKDLFMPQKWNELTLETTDYEKSKNSIALLTGEKNNLTVIDVDDIGDWKKFLKEHSKKEPKTVKAMSGSGGFHLYFKYSDKLKSVNSKSKCFGNKYKIDIRNQKGCIIAPPSTYYNKNKNKQVSYKWKIPLNEHRLEIFPDWMLELLVKKKQIPENDKSDLDNEEIDARDTEKLMTMLSNKRVDKYDDWISVGMCIYNITNGFGSLLWFNWSSNSDKYDKTECEKKWKSFRKNNDCKKLSMGSLLHWCKKDSPDKYKDFIMKRKNDDLITKKYPNLELDLGQTITVNNRQCTYLNNRICVFTGNEHKDMNNSLYVDVYNGEMNIKCRHYGCVGKYCPCPSIKLTKNEMNLINYGNVNVTINNYCGDSGLLDFPKCEIFENDTVNDLVYESLSGEDAVMADIAYYYFKDKYNYEDNNWYVYENHKWSLAGIQNHKLSMEIEKKLKLIYLKLIKYGKDNEFDDNKIKELRKIKKYFGKAQTKRDIMTLAKERFFVNKNLKSDFVKKLDKNNHLIGFENGVYDLEKFEFRDGKYDDYISMSVGYKFRKTHSSKYKQLLNFLSDIQPNENERDYLLTYLSHALYGNMLELFTILTGSGRNGKSKLIELIKKTFGEYYGSAKSQMFTRPQPDASTPDPGLLSLCNKRIVISSEPEKRAKLNSGFIKFITGRDSTQLRECHKNKMIDFSPRFVTLFICNDIPDTDDIDTAFSKRLRCINFPMEFCENPVPNNQRQKKVDTCINEKFDEWKFDFMLLLIEYYKKYTETKKMVITDNILKWTNQYKENTDIYLSFLNECTERSNTHIRTSALYEGFKTWFVTNNPKTRIPSNREFTINIKKHKKVLKIRDQQSIVNGIKNLQLIIDNIL